MIGCRCTILFILLFFAVGSVTRASDNPPVKYLGIEQGLSNNAVTSVYQDAKGFLWFGTYDGLNRYDGYNFIVYRNVIGDSTSLAFNNVNTVTGDGRGNIWAGGQKGISILDPVTSTFSIPWYLPLNGNTLRTARENVHILRAAGDDYILAGTHNVGLLVFEGRSNVAVQISLPGTRSANYDVPCIAYDTHTHNVWLFIQGKGLYSYDLRRRVLRLVNNVFRTGSSIAVDPQGRVWLGTENGLYQLSVDEKSFSPNRMPQGSRVVGITTGNHNELYIGSDGAGVWRLTSGSDHAVPLLSSDGTPLVNSNAVYAIYEDADDRKWIGTLRGGINIIEPRNTSFKTITYDPPGPKNIVNNFILSFCEDADRNVWIGTDGAGLRYWDRKKNTFIVYRNNPADPGSLNSNFITNIVRDYQDRLWVATWFGGINLFNRVTGRFEHYPCFNPHTGEEEKHTWMLLEDKQKRLWASATNDGSLYLFNPALNKFELFDDQVQDLQSLTEDSHEILWGGNYNSLIRIDREHKQHRVYPIGYPVRCLHEDREGRFWVGTQEGGLLLFYRSTGRFERFTTKDGLPSNTILRILEDHRGHLWLSTYNGLSEYSDGNFRNFSPSDGLQSAQFSFNAAIALSTGEFLFGGIKGFNSFFPDSIGQTRQRSNLYLTRVRVRNTPIEAASKYVTGHDAEQIRRLTLPFDQAMLSLDFTALEYDGTDKVNYAYSLVGWDKGWINSNGSRTANYSSLREGSYTFKVKVSHADGAWSPETELLQLVILPPWYRTWWAYLIYAFVIAGGVLTYIKYTRSKERLRYEVKLAHLENEKEKELIERKLSFFTHITHEFRNPLTLIINPVKELLTGNGRPDQKESLPFVYRNAQRLLSLVDQLLLFRKTESGSNELKPMLVNIVELSREVYLCFVQGARAKKIDYRFEPFAEEIPLYVDREKVEIALYNLISNALKYTPDGGQIVFTILDGSNNDIRIVIADNGLGIPVEVGDQVFDKFYQIRRSDMTSISGFGIGLYLVKQFVEAHKGSIHFQSQRGQGTTFSLRLRKGKDHLAGLSIIEDTTGGSPLFREIAEPPTPETGGKKETAALVTDRQSLLIVDDDPQLLSYVSQIFDSQFIVYKALSGEEGLALARRHHPDLIISDLHMDGISGIELCETIKNDPLLGKIPVILLTASASANNKLEGVKHGADDYITKPFDKELLVARVSALLTSRDRVHQSFYNEITLGNPTGGRVSAEDKEFLDRLVAVVEKNLEEDEFSIKRLSQEMGMSHSTLYQRVKELSGQSVNGFIRFIRLRRAAELFISTDCNVNEAALQVGINDVKYFREQFHKLFGLNPSEYIRKYRKVFSGKYLVNREELNPDGEA